MKTYRLTSSLGKSNKNVSSTSFHKPMNLIGQIIGHPWNYLWMFKSLMPLLVLLLCWHFFFSFSVQWPPVSCPWLIQSSLSESQVVYFGDSMHSDIFPAHHYSNWETVLILEELRGQEVKAEEAEPLEKRGKYEVRIPSSLFLGV